MKSELNDLNEAMEIAKSFGKINSCTKVSFCVYDIITELGFKK